MEGGHTAGPCRGVPWDGGWHWGQAVFLGVPQGEHEQIVWDPGGNHSPVVTHGAAAAVPTRAPCRATQGAHDTGVWWVGMLTAVGMLSITPCSLHPSSASAWGPRGLGTSPTREGLMPSAPSGAFCFFLSFFF